jgi:hypothetical protein
MTRVTPGCRLNLIVSGGTGPVDVQLRILAFVNGDRFLCGDGAQLGPLQLPLDRFHCELRKQGEFGFEAQFFQNDELYTSRRFDERKQAIEWAISERASIEHGPCPRCGGAGWLCEAHPGELADHDRQCHGPAMACQACQP